MFRPLFVNFAIFNIADIFITLGFATFCIHFIYASFKNAKKEKKDFKTVPASLSGDKNEMYNYPDEFGEPDFDSFSDTKVVPSGNFDSRYVAQPEAQRPVPGQPEHAVQAPVQEQREQPASWQEYCEPVPDASAEVASALEAISALDALESELVSNEDYDVDKMLREYGFEEEEE
jgi:hypothetical protein